MFLKNSFLTEFLSETNLILTQVDRGNKLNDIVSPIKNYFQKEKDVLTFSLARYAGGNTHLAFFSEWYYQTVKLTLNRDLLTQENKEYLKKKIAIHLRGVPNIFSLVDNHIEEVYIPWQISFMQLKSNEVMTDIVKSNPFLSKYLNEDYLNQVIASELTSIKPIYTEKMNLSEFLEAQSSRTSFLQISFPCLVGFCYNFNQKDSLITPKGVKWVMLEELLKNIAALHQTSQDQDLSLFLYQQNMDEKEQFGWYQFDRTKQIHIVMQTPEIKAKVKEVREKLYKRSLSQLESLVFPEKYREMLRDLIDWSYAAGR